MTKENVSSRTNVVHTAGLGALTFEFLLSFEL